ncbi:hypothetical protein MGYG_05235 [Nannizzia gypsea CBS 118893]|uniref:Borealin N-terminal domain-containing protein n=1 Tax=Arthroderma gypseum (strain ATCC MYA-4604 / CBS 118893) TaxID=535722 RepID=E4UVA5_ARTGP|nr:hypothetical protein MGYG_05235 [Nannizzia gypsea CBS 118893]EFR02232.1 hypothetical protein MGYG_05235 [Nannizzia gypsea CBS 118893]
MSAAVSRKRKSPEPSSQYDEAHTPTRSPSKKKLRITQKQKQALMDNLQLEITERARKLRAHYALQAQDLRARIERRINRIPMALRKQNLGELLAKYSEAAKETTDSRSPFKKPSLPSKNTKTVRPVTQAPATSTARRSGALRQSHGSSDKENAGYPDLSNHPLTNPKQRSKPTLPAASSRNVSQRTESNILSPKSSNSRTFPQSPLKMSPTKPQQQEPYHIRAFSPLKHTSPTKHMNYAATPATPKLRTMRGAAGVRRVTPPDNSSDSAPGRVPRPKKAMSIKSAPGGSRRPPTRPGTRQTNRQVSTSTTSSNASVATAGTTIVRSAKSAAPKKPEASNTASKKPPTSRGRAATTASAATASTTRKITVAAARKGQGAEQPAPGRRVLRSRV